MVCYVDPLKSQENCRAENEFFDCRVKAKNKEGQSNPLTADQYVQIKDPWDEPGKPSRPEIIDYDADKIDIAWQPPTEDGGAPIEEYIIEMKDPVTQEWRETARSPSTFTLLIYLPNSTFSSIKFSKLDMSFLILFGFAFSATSASITGLKEGNEYQFRVKAVNKAGPGQPSKPSEKQVAKPKFGKFRFVLKEQFLQNNDFFYNHERILVPAWLKMDNLKSLTVKAGQSVKWDVEIGGEPTPEVKWLKNDEVLISTNSLQVIFTFWNFFLFS